MFDLKAPCKNCPFKRGMGEHFGLPEQRLSEIFSAQAFQCHKTVDYEHHDDPDLRQGIKPQQCAGLMALLHAEGRPNTIMQVASRLIDFDAAAISTKDTYTSFSETIAAHTQKKRP